MKAFLLSVILAAMPVLASAQEAETAQGGELRVLDKLNGIVTDVTLSNGESRRVGYLTLTLSECRYPRANPSGDAFADVQVRYGDQQQPGFEGWLIASAPALNAMEHPRYDVWVLRCIRS